MYILFIGITFPSRWHGRCSHFRSLKKELLQLSVPGLPHNNNNITITTTMKLAFAIATVAALQKAAIVRADCGFGSNYTSHFNSSGYCSFDFGFGAIRNNSSETNTISSGDTNVTTYTARGNKIAIWKMGDKDSTVQCYPDISGETVSTSYLNGSVHSVVWRFCI